MEERIDSLSIRYYMRGYKKIREFLNALYRLQPLIGGDVNKTLILKAIDECNEAIRMIEDDFGRIFPKEFVLYSKRAAKK